MDEFEKKIKICDIMGLGGLYMSAKEKLIRNRRAIGLSVLIVTGICLGIGIADSIWNGLNIPYLIGMPLAGAASSTLALCGVLQENKELKQLVKQEELQEEAARLRKNQEKNQRDYQKQSDMADKRIESSEQLAQQNFESTVRIRHSHEKAIEGEEINILEQPYQEPVITEEAVQRIQSRTYYSDQTYRDYYTDEEFQQRSDEVLSRELPGEEKGKVKAQKKNKVK